MTKETQQDKKQIRFTFDKETLRKIARGALISITSAGSLALLDYIGTIKVENAIVASLISWAIPVITNAIYQWQKGA